MSSPTPDPRSPMNPETTVAVVTGAARGIGRAIAEALVAGGHAVVIADLDSASLATTAAEIGAAAYVAVDVRDPEAHRKLATVAATHGRLAVWVNNAGVGDAGVVTELDDAAVQRLVEVNLLGVVWGTRAAIEAFAGQGGDIVNVASLSGLGPVPGLSAYAATKAAVVSLTLSTNAEQHPGVRAHALCPDGVKTQMVAAMDPQGLGAQLVNSGGRLLTAEQTARAAVRLIGSRRVIHTVPRWRGGAMRLAALTPRTSQRLMSVFAAQGRRRLSKDV